MISIPQIDATFSGLVFIGLISSDGAPCSLTITEFALLRTDRLH